MTKREILIDDMEQMEDSLRWIFGESKSNAPFASMLIIFEKMEVQE